MVHKTVSAIPRSVNQITGHTNNKRKSNQHSDPTRKIPKSSGFVAQARKYSNSEWKQLSVSQREQVKSLHKLQRQNSDQHNGNNNRNANSRAMVPYQRPLNGPSPPTRFNHPRQANQVQNGFGMQPSNCYQHQMIPSTHQQHFVNQVIVPPQRYGLIPPPPPPRAFTDLDRKSVV